MWHITQAARAKMEQAQLFIMRETDEEWEGADDPEHEAYRAQFFEDNKEQLLRTVPAQFHPAIVDGSLNRRDIAPAIRTAFLDWQQEQREMFYALQEQAYKNREHALSFMPTHVQDVFLDSLHDFRVEQAVYTDDSLRIDFDTSGGFSAKSFVSVTLKGIVAEEERIAAGDYYIYDELMKTERGIAWRVLLNDDKQWTIEAREWDAQFYFAPKTKGDFRGSDDFEGYVGTLELAHGLHVITPHMQTKITSLTPFCTEAGALSVQGGVYIGEERVADTLGDCIALIHSEVYEDPYAHFSEPVAVEDLEVYALGADLECKVRAWNTMYENPQQFAEIINKILLQLDREKEDEMLQFAYVNHFSKAGILTQAVQERFRDFFE